MVLPVTILATAPRSAIKIHIHKFRTGIWRILNSVDIVVGVLIWLDIEVVLVGTRYRREGLRQRDFGALGKIDVLVPVFLLERRIRLVFVDSVVKFDL